MKRYIKTLIIICGVALLSACATKQEAAPDADGAAPATSEETMEAPTPEPSPDAQGVEAEPAPAPPSDVDPDRESAPAKAEDSNDAVAPDAAIDGLKTKGSTDEDKPAPNNKRLSKPKPSNAGPAAKEAPCDPDESEDCDPKLLRKLPGR